jgi:hypothetical protein
VTQNKLQYYYYYYYLSYLGSFVHSLPIFGLEGGRVFLEGLLNLVHLFLRQEGGGPGAPSQLTERGRVEPLDDLALERPLPVARVRLEGGEKRNRH